MVSTAYKRYKIRNTAFCPDKNKADARQFDGAIELEAFPTEMELIGSSFPILAFAGSIAFAAYAKGKACNGKSAEITVSELWVYPIKSCRGIKMDTVQVTARGFHLDRIFMVVDSTGKFVSQRSHPAMALIDVQIVNDAGKS
jgi:hypothetical protein